jgi:uncharacterized protein
MADVGDQRSLQIHLAVIQPSPFCNIDCSYCYLPGRAALHRMSQETVKRSFQFLLEKPDRLVDPFVIAWHAGEPLAVPIDFYDSAFHLLEGIAPVFPSIENWFQTNATLIDDDWCRFIKRWNIKIGISVDGPEWLHDSHRVDRSGRGTFRKVLRGIEMLRSNGIDFATIGVLSERSLSFPEEIWRFYQSLGVRSLAFNFEDVEGVHSTSSLHGQDIFSRAQQFFENLLYLRNSEAPDTYIRELDELLDGLRKDCLEFRRMDNVPLGIVGIDWNGDVSTFSPELIGVKHPHYGDFVIGNVARDTLDTVLLSSKFCAVHGQIESGVEKCRKECEYFGVCGGGQPSNKLFQNGTFDSAETPSCRLRIKSVANVAVNFLEKQRGVRGPVRPMRQQL